MMSTWLEHFPVDEGSYPLVKLIAFPGAGKGPDSFQPLAAALPKDFEVVGICYPGRGRRFGEAIPGSIAEYAAQIFDALKGTLRNRPSVFIGHSMGAAIAAEVAALAEQDPEVMQPMGLIALGSTSGAGFEGPPQDDDEAAEWARKFALSGGMITAQQAADLEPALLKALYSDLRALAAHEAGQQQGRVGVPLLAIAADDDSLAPPSLMHTWEQRLSAAAPALQTYSLARGGHNFHEAPVSELIQVLTSSMLRWVEAQPTSVAHGEVRRPRYPEATVHELFHQAAEKHGDIFAVVPTKKEEAVTYKEFQRRVLILAKRLCGMGVAVDRLCPIFMERSLEFMLALFGSISAEGAFAQLEISFPSETVATILSKIEPVVILTKERYLAKLPKDMYQVVCLDQWASIEGGLLPADVVAYEKRLRATPDDLYKVPLTSGSTGIPKSIGQVHRAAVSSYHWRQTYVPYGERENEAANVFFIWEAARPLLYGATLHIMSEACILDANTFVDFCLDRDITRMLLTPSMGETLVDTIQDLSFPKAKRDAIASSRWSLLVHCGEVVSRALQKKWLSLLPKMVQLNLYSIAEVYDATCSMSDSDASSALTGLYMQAGPVMDGVTVLVLRQGKNGLEFMPMGAVGDIYVAGPGVARGYLKNPEKTAEAFLPNPFTQGELAKHVTIYKTGDIGRFEQGPAHDPRPILEIWGRTDSVIKLRGYSVEKGAVKSAIDSFPGPPSVEWVEIFRDNDPDTLRTKRILAAVLLKHGTTNGKSEADILKELREWARTKLPAYALPAMCIIDELPISASSTKADLKQVLQICTDKLAQQDALAAVGEPTTNALPQQFSIIEQAWQEVLGHSPPDLETSFFEDGGHSLLAAKFLKLLSSQLPGLTLTVLDLMENPTVLGLAAKCGLINEDQPSEPEVAPVQGVPPSLWNGTRPEPIVIVGMSCQFCHLDNSEQFWSALCNKEEAIRHLSNEELRSRGWTAKQLEHPDFKPYGGPISSEGLFDAQFWRIPKGEASFMDPQQRLFLQEAYKALEDAGHGPARSRPELSGVVCATWYSSYLLQALGGGGALRDPTLGAEENHNTELGNHPEYAATRFAYLLNLRGLAMAVQTSCSSGLSTQLVGCTHLLSRQLDLALCGAASVSVPGGGYIAGAGVPLSMDGKTRSFAAQATGTVFTDGVGATVLKRLSDVLARDRNWAQISGYALNQDGSSRASYSAPSVEGQARVLQMALRHAQVTTADVGYLECHATGTVVGDQIEAKAIGKAYGGLKNAPALGCVKPIIGHANIASGVAGIVKTAMVLQRNMIPGTLLLGDVNPHLQDANLVLETQPMTSGAPLGAVSSFGIGGTNAHAILAPMPVDDVGDPETMSPLPNRDWAPFLPLSAKTSTSLKDMAAAYIEFMGGAKDVPLPEVCSRLAARQAFDRRLGVVANSIQDVCKQLSFATKKSDFDPIKKKPLTVLLFSGNGSNYKGLGDGLAEKSDVFGSWLSEMRAACGLTPPASEEDALRAGHAQPALFCVQIALLETLRQWEIPIDAVVGHSLGLFPALVAAGALDRITAAKLITERGRLCEQSTGGAMVSVAGIPENEIEVVLRQFPTSGPEALFIAVRNAPSLVVVSGEETTLQCFVEAVNLAHPGRARCRFLQVQNAYHHEEYMKDAASEFGEFFGKNFGASLRPCSQCLVADNVTGGWLPQDRPVDTSYFSEHLRKPVQFTKNVEAVLALEPDRPLILLELGGVALKQIVQANLKERPTTRPISIFTLSKHAKDETDEATVFGASLAGAWQEGLSLNLDLAISSAAQVSRKPFWMPGYQFLKTPCWAGAAVENAGQSGLQRLVSFGKTRDAKMVIYCFPYAGGSSAGFHAWAKQAPPSLEVVAAELPGRGVRATESPVQRPAYDAEVRSFAQAILQHADGRPAAVLGLSSGAVFALNVMALLEQQRSMQAFVVAGRAPPWVVGAESCSNGNSEEWLLVPDAMQANDEWKKQQIPILDLDLWFDAQGCGWTDRTKIKAPAHIFCGTTDTSFAPSMAHAWGSGLTDFSHLKIAFLQGGHDFILGPELRRQVYVGLFGTDDQATEASANRADTKDTKLVDVASWLHQPWWEALSTPETGPRDCEGSQVVIFGKAGDAFDELLAQTLRQQCNAEPTLLEHSTGGEMSYKDISDHLENAAPGMRKAIYSWLPEGHELSCAEKLLGHRQLILALNAIRRCGDVVAPTLVTILATPATSSVVGEALAATQESPELLCRVLEIQPAPHGSRQSLASYVALAATQEPTDMTRLEPAVCLQPVGGAWIPLGQRYVPVSLPVGLPGDVSADCAMLRKGQTFIITGAMGRIGRTLATHLSRKWDANLILTTRGAGTEEQEDFRKGLVTRGNTVKIVNHTNCHTEEDWAKLFNTVVHDVDGVFHLAGLANLKYLTEMADNVDIMDGEWQPKEIAMEALTKFVDSVAERKPLFVLMFSSMAAILGGFGMSGYAPANRCMDLLANQRKGSGPTKWISVNWDDWAFEYTHHQTAGYTEKVATRSMLPEEGLAVLEAILDGAAKETGPAQVLVSTTALPPRLDEWLHQCARLEGLRQELSKPRHENDAEQGGDSMNLVSRAFQQVLGLDSLPHPDDEFFDLGGDSVSAGSLLRALKTASPKGAADLGISDIFNLQRPRALCERITPEVP